MENASNHHYLLDTVLHNLLFLRHVALDWKMTHNDLTTFMYKRLLARQSKLWRLKELGRQMRELSRELRSIKQWLHNDDEKGTEEFLRRYGRLPNGKH